MSSEQRKISECDLANEVFALALSLKMDVSRIVSLVEEWLVATMNGSRTESIEVAISQIGMDKVRWQDFSSEEDSLPTSNTLSRLLLKYRQKEGSSLTQGLVFTPDWLVDNMVRLAYDCWTNLQISDKGTKLLSSKPHSIPTWFDGCVGTGNFAIGILRFTLSLRGSITEEDLSRLQFADIDETAVKICRLRVALWLISEAGWPSFDRALKIASRQIQHRNTLHDCTQQSRLQFDSQSSWGIGVDIVIGNPPYVRSERMPSNQKNELKELYSSIWTGKSDLCQFFIANSALRCRKGGVVCLIAPASFQRSLTGRKLRGFLSEEAPPSIVFDFNELEVFENVSLDASIFVLTPGTQRSLGRLIQLNSFAEAREITSKIDICKSIEFPINRDLPWRPAVSGSCSSKLAKFQTLAQAGYNILSGLKTGFQEAYVIDSVTAQEFLDDPASKSYLEKLILPREIRKWQSKWKGSYLLNIPKGVELQRTSRLLTWFLKYKDRLESRSDVLGHPTWYGLRECDYLNLMRSPKIIFPDISSSNRFSLDFENILIPDGSFFIPSTNLFLLGILNSRFAMRYFSNLCMSIGRPGEGGRLRFKKAYVCEFKIPIESECDQNIKDHIISLVSSIMVAEETVSLEDQLNEAIEELYAKDNVLKHGTVEEYAFG